MRTNSSEPVFSAYTIKMRKHDLIFLPFLWFILWFRKWKYSCGTAYTYYHLKLRTKGVIQLKTNRVIATYFQPGG